MSRNTLLAIVVISLVSSSLLTAADFYTYTGEAPVTYDVRENSIRDNRTEMEKLSDKVDEMEFFLNETMYLVDEQEQRIEELEASIATVELHNELLQNLSAHLLFGDDEITVTAERINLVATRVDIAADRTTVDDLEAEDIEADDIEADDVEVDTLTAEEVDSESYTPGAGNVW